MKKATREVFGEHLLTCGGNEKVIVLDSDLGSATKVDSFARKYKDRYINTGISEQNMIGMSCGISSLGYIPIATSFAMFTTSRAHEIIRNSVCYPKNNVKIIGTHAGLSVGYDGGSHQCLEDIAIMNTLPNIEIFSPLDEIETKQVLDYAIEHKGPVYIRLGRIKVSNLHKKDYKFKVGKASKILLGNKMAIFSYGILVEVIKEIIEEEKLDIELINMTSLKPIDKEVIKENLNKQAIMTIEEHFKIGGLGSIVASEIAGEKKILFKSIGVNNFGESGSPDDVLDKNGLSKKKIKKEIIKMYKKCDNI